MFIFIITHHCWTSYVHAVMMPVGQCCPTLTLCFVQVGIHFLWLSFVCQRILCCALPFYPAVLVKVMPCFLIMLLPPDSKCYLCWCCGWMWWVFIFCMCVCISVKKSTHSTIPNKPHCLFLFVWVFLCISMQVHLQTHTEATGRTYYMIHSWNW